MVDFTTNPVVTFTKETYVLRSNFTQQTATKLLWKKRNACTRRSCLKTRKFNCAQKFTTRRLLKKIVSLKRDCEVIASK